MATATVRPPSVMRQRRRHLRRDPNALVASAALMSGPNRSPNIRLAVEEWQKLAWQFYDEVGELRAGVTWLSNALSRVNLVCAIAPKAQGDEPTPVDIEAEPRLAAAVKFVEEIAGGVAGQGQMLAACARHLTVPGLGFILATAEDLTDSFSSWRVLSNEEVQKSQHAAEDAPLEVRDSETGEWYPLKANDLLIKVWRSHPRRGWEPDSAVRACLGPLAEIKIIGQRIIADARSRLAGNGLLVMPEEAEFPPGQGNVTGLAEGADEFIETMVQVAEVAIQDQTSPAAKVPLVVRMPGDLCDKAQLIQFWSEFDSQLLTLRDAAIRRLALGLDMPPEVLLGLGDSNHWSAWQIAEEAITLHIEPLAEAICHALTVKFLRNALATVDGIDPDEVIVWYDTSDLKVRPDLSGPAAEAHARDKISDAAYLRYVGLNEEDLPEDDELARRVLVALAMKATATGDALALLVAAGVLDPAQADLAGALAPPPAPAPVDEPTDERTPPDRQDEPPAEEDPPADEELAAAALVAAADGIIERALEVAGQRLRNAAAKKLNGGAASIVCDDPTLLHTTISATDHASLDHLLNGAWRRVPTIAARHGIDPASLQACLTSYARALISTGHAHDINRLSAALGATIDRRVAASV